MSADIYKKIKQKTEVWREVALPGLSIVVLVLISHLTGLLRWQEWTALDDFLRLRPTENLDPRVVIVGINESDIKSLGGFPVPDSKLAEMLRILEKYKPRVIGLDIFKDQTSSVARAELAKTFREIPNIIGIEVALNKEAMLNVKPPPELPADRVGIADFVVDSDGKLRRSLLASKTPREELKYSLSLRLATAYLRDEGIGFKHDGTRSYDPIEFGSRSLPRLLTDSREYVSENTQGEQMLLNFRSNRKPFRTISLTDVLNGNFDPSWIRSHIIIIEMAAPSVKDTFITSAVKSTLYTSALGDEQSSNQLLYGVEVHAHATSQIVSTVLDERPFLRVWSASWEALWILFWGLSGSALGLILQSPWKTLLGIGIASVGLVGICFIILLLGWWIPVVPTLLALSGAGLTTSFFDRDLRILLEQRSLTLQRTFDAIHNGPLQTLAVLLRNTGLEDLSPNELRSQLQELNQELRSVYESMEQEMLKRSDCLYLEGNVVLELQTPIDELLYQVYDITLTRGKKLPGFTTIKTYIPPDFKPLEDCYLSQTQKRCLCLFLQEALCNVGKHALRATCLEVICTRSHSWYSLSIIDNGAASTLSSNPKCGRGRTQQAQELARQLEGKFRRQPRDSQGTICELTWPNRKDLVLAIRNLARWMKKRHYSCR